MMMTAQHRVPVFQHTVPHNNMLSDQQRTTSNHAVRTVVNDAPQNAHILPASDVRHMTSNNVTVSSTVPSVPVHVEGTNGGISYRPVQMGDDLPGRLVVDPKSGHIAPQLISRLPGLQYDVIPPRTDGPSEAERKVAVLTQQLENEMRLTTSQGSLLRQQMTNTLSQYRSPPPYYGPHITANVKMATPSNQLSNNVTVTGDSDVASKASGDVDERQIVTSLSSTVTDVDQPQPSVHPGSDVDALTECYGKPGLVM